MASISALILLTTLSAGGGDVELLQFTAPWCGPCRSMEPTIRRLAEDGYPVRQVNIDQHPDIARRYGVRPIPCFVLVSKGQEVDRIVGATSYDRLVQMFRQIPATPASNGGPTPGSPTDVVRAQSPDEESERAGLLKGLARFARGQRQPDDYQQASRTTEFERAGRAAPPNTLAPPPASSPHAPSASRSSAAMAAADPRQRALHATVRLKVSDPDGHSYGTGTIVDVHGDEALVVTCGHVFRDSQGKGQIEVTLFLPDGEQTIPGHLLAFDADHRDIGLVFIRPPKRVVAAPVAGPDHASRIGDPVFSVGCDQGAAPSVRNSRVTNVNRYLGPPNIESSGHPIDGRSGGGLFTARGELIGVCNAADPIDDEGVYAALATIHWQLDQIGQSRVYQRTTPETAPAQQIAATRDTPELDAPARLSPLPASHAGGRDLTPVAEQQPVAQAAGAGTNFSADSELICILRSPDQPEGRRLIVVKGPSRELVEQLQRQSNPARGITNRAPGSSEMTALPRIEPPSQRRAPTGRGEVVRGQNGN